MISTLTRKPLPKILLLYACGTLLAALAGVLVAKGQVFEDDLDLFVTLGAVLVAGVLFAILLEWRLGVFLLAFLLPFEGMITLGGSPASEGISSDSVLGSGTKGLALLTFLSVGLRLLRDRKLYAKLRRLLQEPLILTLAVFTCWSMASIVWATNQAAALVKTSSFLGLLGLVLTVGLLKAKEITWLWVIIAVAAVLSVPLGYVFTPPEVAHFDPVATINDPGRLTSGGKHPNDYAGFLTITFLVTYYMLNKRFAVARYLLALPIFFGVLASQSRTGLIVLIATPLLAVLVPSSSKRSVKLLVSVLALAALIFVGVLYAVPSMGEVLSDRYATLSQYESEETWAGRWELWGAGFSMILSSPFLGVGAGNFSYVAPTYSGFAASLNAAEGEDAAVAHNVLLSVAGELGLVGLALFTVIFLLAFKRALVLAGRVPTSGGGLLLGLVAYVIMSQTTQWDVEKIGYFVIGSILALSISITPANRISRTSTREAQRLKSLGEERRGSLRVL